MDVLLNTPLGPELLRISITGSFFGWAWPSAGCWASGDAIANSARPSAARRARCLTIEKILLERLPDGLEVMRIRSCGRDPIDAVFPNPAARDAFLARVDKTKADPAAGLDA